MVGVSERTYGFTSVRGPKMIFSNAFRRGVSERPLLTAISMDPVANQAKPIFEIARSRFERVGVDREWSP
jgi:hypothetical protein